MVNGLTGSAVLDVARIFRDGTLLGMSDREILERFVEQHDEAAFEAILTRHGSMVRNVCRQILVDPHDADDAFQAVFLVLVRKARSLQLHESLGPWLYSVAGRLAGRARANRRKLRAREAWRGEGNEPSYSMIQDGFETALVLHEELLRLPDRLRAPLVLCYLEGLTHDLAARQLDCPVGTVRSRLARGRNLLHRRITRRGLTLSVAVFAGVLESTARAAVATQLPASLIAVVTRAMFEWIQRQGIGLIPSCITFLKGVLKVSQVKKITVLATVISVGALALALPERSKVAGQTPEQQARSDATQPAFRAIGPDGRPIGTLPARDANKAFPKTYYVGDIVPMIARKNPANEPATDDQRMADMTPLIDLIEMTVAPGTWNIQDGYGHARAPRKSRHGNAASGSQNAMVPFFLSVSLIVRCSPEVHEDIADLLRCVRRLKDGDERETETRIIGPALPPSVRYTTTKLPTKSIAERRKRIEQLLDQLRNEVAQLEKATGEVPEN
jgi:RNA polymerase sigma factor (sigma-70 family)